MDYEKLRMDIIETLIEQRDIKCRKNKTEMVKYLKLDDEEKYVRDTTFEKYAKDDYLIGVDINNHRELVAYSKLAEKNEVKRIGLYQCNRIFFTSNKIIEV